MPLPQSEQRTHYEVLGVETSASAAEIRKAFRRLALRFHPDKANGDHEQFQLINIAQEVLLDSKERAKYNREQAKKSSVVVTQQQQQQQQQQQAQAQHQGFAYTAYAPFTATSAGGHYQQPYSYQQHSSSQYAYQGPHQPHQPQASSYTYSFSQAHYGYSRPDPHLQRPPGSAPFPPPPSGTSGYYSSSFNNGPQPNMKQHHSSQHNQPKKPPQPQPQPQPQQHQQKPRSSYAAPSSAHNNWNDNNSTRYVQKPPSSSTYDAKSNNINNVNKNSSHNNNSNKQRTKQRSPSIPPSSSAIPPGAPPLTTPIPDFNNNNPPPLASASASASASAASHQKQKKQDIKIPPNVDQIHRKSGKTSSKNLDSWERLKVKLEFPSGSSGSGSGSGSGDSPRKRTKYNTKTYDYSSIDMTAPPNAKTFGQVPIVNNSRTSSSKNNNGYKTRTPVFNSKNPVPRSFPFAKTAMRSPSASAGFGASGRRMRTDLEDEHDIDYGHEEEDEEEEDDVMEVDNGHHNNEGEEGEEEEDDDDDDDEEEFFEVEELEKNKIRQVFLRQREKDRTKVKSENGSADDVFFVRDVNSKKGEDEEEDDEIEVLSYGEFTHSSRKEQKKQQQQKKWKKDSDVKKIVKPRKKMESINESIGKINISSGDDDNDDDDDQDEDESRDEPITESTSEDHKDLIEFSKEVNITLDIPEPCVPELPDEFCKRVSYTEYSKSFQMFLITANRQKARLCSFLVRLANFNTEYLESYINQNLDIKQQPKIWGEIHMIELKIQKRLQNIDTLIALAFKTHKEVISTG